MLRHTLLIDSSSYDRWTGEYHKTDFDKDSQLIYLRLYVDILITEYVTPVNKENFVWQNKFQEDILF